MSMGGGWWRSEVGRSKKSNVGTPGGRGRAQSASARRRDPVSPPFAHLSEREIAIASEELFNPEITEFSSEPDFVDYGGEGIELSLGDHRPQVKVESLQRDVLELQRYVRALADKFKALEWSVGQLGQMIRQGGSRGMKV